MIEDLIWQSFLKPGVSIYYKKIRKNRYYLLIFIKTLFNALLAIGMLQIIQEHQFCASYNSFRASCIDLFSSRK